MKTIRILLGFLWFIPINNGLNAQETYNVLFICADGLRPTLGCYGDSYAVTPHIDGLAKKGIVFERAYCQQASCAPSRASLMTGLRPDTLQIISGNVHFRDVLPDAITLPQAFKRHGYHTQAFGLVYHAHPPQPDSVSWSIPEQLLDIPKRDEYLLPTNRIRGFINRMEKGTATEAVEAPDNAYQDGQVAQLAIETLTHIKEKPFFLAVGFKRPHLPFSVPKKYWDIYDSETIPLPVDTVYPVCTPQEVALRYSWQYNKGEMRAYTDIPDEGSLDRDKIKEVIHGYYASVSYIDNQIGRLLQALDSLDLSRKTIVVLWSDHGCHLGERGLWGKNDLTENSARVPLVVSVPDMRGAGQKSRALVELVDVYPTLIALCGISVPFDLHGVSLVPVLENPHRELKSAAFSSYPRMGNTVMGYSVRTSGYRYTEYLEIATGKVIDRELYNMDKDPLQYENLVREKGMKAVVSHHQTLLNRQWEK